MKGKIMDIKSIIGDINNIAGILSLLILVLKFFVLDRISRHVSVRKENGETICFTYSVATQTQEQIEKSVCASNSVFVKKTETGWVEVPNKRPM